MTTFAPSQRRWGVELSRSSESKETELFDTYTDQGESLGTMSRDRVHRLGVWHRAVNVFLFNEGGELLIQQRAAAKDVCPLKWDLSVAEHLQVGENYEQAAVRGVQEELGTSVNELVPYGEPTTHQLVLPEQDLRNREMTQCYRGTLSSALVISIDPAEVADTQWIALFELHSRMQAQPNDFTPWFRDLAIHVGLFPAAPCSDPH